MARKKTKSIKSKPKKQVGRGNVTQTVKISIGGQGKGQGQDLLELYKKQAQPMGGQGQSSTPSYPSSPSYYRLTGPQQQFASTPDALSGRNQAVPNNLVSHTLLRPSHGDRGVASASASSLPAREERPSSLLSQAYAKMSQRIVPSAPEPNRPISAVQSDMVAGRPIIHDPTLPSQKPTGRDNYVMPYDAERGAPDSGYFPQQGQDPVTVAEEQNLQEQVGQGSESKAQEVQYDAAEIEQMSEKGLRKLAVKLGVTVATGSGSRKRYVPKEEALRRILEELYLRNLSSGRASSASSSSSTTSSGAF